MISIIICSINIKLLQSVSKSIKQTIGVIYEIIVIDNNIEKLSISQAYNKGAKKAKYKYLVFCHEDILFHTQNWGKHLTKILKKDEIGLVGISGATYKSEYPTSWISVPEKFIRINAIQHYKNIPQKIIKNPFNEKTAEVVVIDGLFMASTKSVFKQTKGFDEKLIDGFHLYDFDFSLKVLISNYKIVVTYSILIEHFSGGNLNLNWLKKSMQWHKAKKRHLPVFCTNLSKSDKKIIQKSSLGSVIISCFSNNFATLLMIKSLLNLIICCPLSLNNFKYMKFVVSFLLGIPKIKKYANRKKQD